jgi:hypothetical protein
VAELTPVVEEVAILWTREVDAHWDVDKAKEKLAALAERACLDSAKTEWLWKKQDELLQTTVRLWQEHDNAS